MLGDSQCVVAVDIEQLNVKSHLHVQGCGYKAYDGMLAENATKQYSAFPATTSRVTTSNKKGMAMVEQGCIVGNWEVRGRCAGQFEGDELELMEEPDFEESEVRTCVHSCKDVQAYTLQEVHFCVPCCFCRAQMLNCIEAGFSSLDTVAAQP